MAEPKRPKDGRDSETLPGAKGGVSQQGSAGGRLQRDLGSRDEEKRATERPAGRTGVTRETEEDDG